MSVLDGAGNVKAHVFVATGKGQARPLAWTLTSPIASTTATFAFCDPSGPSACSAGGIDLVHGAADFADLGLSGSTWSWGTFNARLGVARYNANVWVMPASGTPYQCQLSDLIIINRGD